MTIDQVKVIEIGADAIEEVLLNSAGVGLAYPPKLMHAVVAALGRHGYIIEDRYEDSEGKALSPPEDMRPEWVIAGKTAPDWDTSGDDM